jgi:hypothetical protein
LIRLLGFDSIAGANPHTGGELQTVSTPSNGLLFTAPAVWRDGFETWMFAADSGGTTAWRISNGQLTQIWSKSIGGSSPVVVGGLLYVYEREAGDYTSIIRGVDRPLRRWSVARAIGTARLLWTEESRSRREAPMIITPSEC